MDQGCSIQSARRWFDFRPRRLASLYPPSSDSNQTLASEILTAADCLKSLHFPSFALRQDTARDALPGTFEWIWQAKDSCFKKWIQSGSGIFWISGKPGSGKTTLVKYLIANRGQIEQFQTFLYSENQVNQAIQKPRVDRDLILAAHFFDHEGEHLAHSVTGLLRSLLFQLLRARPQLFEVILPRYEEMKRFHTAIAWSYQDLNVAFTTMLRHPKCGPVMFFIDALDEAEEEHDEIGRLITEYSDVSSKDTQFCVSSRPSADFNFYFANPEAKICPNEYTSQDIHHFVNESFQELASRYNTNYGTLIDQIALKAENVFLWARLVVEDLLRAARRRETVERLLHRLQKMPIQLHHFYRRMIDQASDHERSEALQILGIVLSAMVPLSIGELQDAMEHCSNQDPRQELCRGQPNAFHNSLIPAEHFAERIESICFGLVEVRTIFQRKEPRTEVAFAHHTVNEFLGTLNDESKTQGGTNLTARGNLDLLSACVDCMGAVNNSDYFRVLGINEQPDRQSLAGETTSSDSKPEWPQTHDQYSWTEAELNVHAFVICPFLRYATFHWAQHARVIEFETDASYHAILSKLTPFNFRLWSLLMRLSDESRNSVEGRKIVIPSTLLENATVFGLTKFVEEELQSSLADILKTFQLKEHQSSDLNMIYGRLLYAAATGGDSIIAEALMIWGAKFNTSLRCIPDALSRAIFRGNFSVASVFCDHGALSKISGVYLEGFKIQSQYRTSDVLTIRIADRASQLKATPTALMKSIQSESGYISRGMFRKCADFDTATAPATLDYIAILAKWEPEIAIDDFAVAFESSYKKAHSGLLFLDPHTGKAIPMQRQPKELHTYVMDEDTEAAQDGGSIRYHILTVELLPTKDIESSLAMLREYKAAYGRLPKLDITAFNHSSVSQDLTKLLLDLGYSMYEHEHPGMRFEDTFSMERPIPPLAADVD